MPDSGKKIDLCLWRSEIVSRELGERVGAYSRDQFNQGREETDQSAQIGLILQFDFAKDLLLIAAQRPKKIE